MKKIFLGVHWFVILSLVIGYVILFFNTPEQPNTSGLEIGEQTRLILRMSILVILLLIWFFGSLAVVRSFAYAKETKNDRFKALFRSIGAGMMVLTGGSIITSFVGQIRSYNPYNAEMHRAITILLNYLYVFIPFISFWYIYCAVSHKYHARLLRNKNIIVGATITAVIGIFWMALIFTNPERQSSELNSPSFYINDTLIIFTIVIPTILAWFFGVMATLRMSDIAVETQNVLQKHALSKIIIGIWLLIFDNILLSGLLSVGIDRLVIIGTNGIIIIVYVFVFINLFAYQRISSGIKEMSLLEISA
jgi:hypothetical protein